jgi:cytochrome c peroxidase
MRRASSIGGWGLSLLGTLVLVACTDESSFTSEQREVLEGFALPASIPADPSNRVADDARARVLGKQLYFDPRFSGALGPINDGVSNGSLGPSGMTGKVACASCHAPEAGGGDRRSRPYATSLGAGYTGRNSPSVINAAYADIADGGWQFWDGRKDSLWSQALGPSESGLEHNGSRLAFAHLMFDHYKAPYEAVFGALPDLADTVRFPPNGKPGDATFDAMPQADRDAVNKVFANFGKAIAAYERALVSPSFAPSPFDQMLAGDDAAMTPAAIRGARLFIGKAGCDECHRGSAFTDFKFHNIGCPQTGEHALLTDVGRFAGIETVKGDVFNRAGPFSDHPDDAHLRNLTAIDATIGGFKTPTLRNIGKTGPYMHDGVYEDLWAVTTHYNFGGGTGAYSGTKEVTIAPLLLDNRELDDLVEFLKSLDDGDALPHPDFPEGLVAVPTLPL